MKKRSFFLAIFIIFFLQVALLDKLKLFNIKPDILLAVTVLAALSFELKWSIIFAVFAGLLKDIAGIEAFGLNLLLFPLWGYLTVRLSRKFSIENNLFSAAFIFFIALANAFLSRAMLIFFGNYEISAVIFLRVAFLESAYTSLTAPLLAAILKPWLSRD